jgi:hypothetical protein
MNVPQEQQGYYPEELPPEQEPLEPQVMPVNEPPLQEPIQPPTQPPVQAPIQPPTQPPVQAPIQPPAKQPMRPPVQPKIPKRQIPGVPKGKVIIPSNQIKVPKVKMAFGINTPKILIGVGRGLPKLPFVPMGHHPHGPMGRPVHRPMVHPPHAMGFIPPVQQKKIVIVGPRGVAQAKVAKQIGAMMNAVNKVMTPMVGISAKRLGLRSTKPTTTQKDDVKQENVLRARRNDVNNYNEQQEEVLCPECANEEYLAQLREELKGMEAAGEFAVLVPLVDKALENPEQEELFINAYNHTARRVKDCTSVAGFELAEKLKDKQAFMDTLAIKHAQYVYFTKAENPLSDDIVVY